MRSILLSILLVGGMSPCPSLAGATEDADELAMRIESRLKTARYMEQDCQPTTYQGWEGFETVRCSYSVVDGKTGVKKTGIVIMLNPSARLLATWMLEACRTQRSDLPRSACTTYLFNRVIRQSGGQFVVSGVVYEDIIPEDRVHEAYAFRDGVTVYLDGIKHRSVHALSTPELESALQSAPIDTVTQGAFARIVGTSRNEYRWTHPKADVDRLKWLTAVRTSYQKAWRSSRNELMELWLRNNPPRAAH